MAFNNLPPQAYTRDVLMAAYDWLQSQTGSIRELAVSPDSLVTLYLQSRRRAPVTNGAQAQNPNPVIPVSQQAPMTPASAEAFKQDLKSLAEGLRQFDDPQKGQVGAQPTTPPAPAQQLSQLLPPTSEVKSPLSNHGTTPYKHFVSASASNPLPVEPAPINSVPVPAQTVNPTSTTEPQLIANASLDNRSLALIQEVKNKLNLSQDNEALRLLLALGYEKIRDILPKN